MKRLNTILLLLACGLSTGCAVEEAIDAIGQSIDQNTIWVNAQFNVPEKEGFEDYYYYGRISKEIYREIIDGVRTEGFIVLRDIRYWDLENNIRRYEDHADTGVIVFRIQDLAKLSLQKGDPWILERENDEGESSE